MLYVFENVRPFNLKAVLDGGQAFRWKEENGRFTGIVKNRFLAVDYSENTLLVEVSKGSSSKEEDIRFIMDYFDLNRDYNALEEKLTEEYPELKKAIADGSGNRILHQDPWETLISFIISANNSIPNIKRVIERLCENYGSPIIYKGKTYYAFPTPDALSSLTEEEISCTRCGFRGKYIIKAAKMVKSKEVDLQRIEKLDSKDALKELVKIPGVGIKVASCILLFSYRKYDSFPVDVWIKRAVEEIYFNGCQKNIKEIIDFAHKKFADKAGFVQQYLFYYFRGKNI
ncbi:DNA-3-methyladenine glycosylase family protein [Thermovenabulum sp.]|uniref:DNA-3-methyladenine glycosylase family protein n=1 Tax=Thermovenabulum sp. TaxID=3100335 RepID=UPI003C7ACB77